MIFPPPLRHAKTTDAKRRGFRGWLVWLLAWQASALALEAVELEATAELFLKGAYQETVEAAKAGATSQPDRPEWSTLLIRALGQIGKYRDARDAASKAVAQFPLDLHVRMAAYEALRNAGATAEAKTLLTDTARLAESREWSYRSPADRVAMGKIALLIGADPKRVLEVFFDPIRKGQPDFRESYLASGEVALDKNDFALAAKNFGAATKKFPDDPDIWFGLARSYAPTSAKATTDALEKTLKFNPHHLGAHLLLADNHIDAEDYEAADKALAEALKINPHFPEGHAYRAVLAYLRGDEKIAKEARAAALQSWGRNPNVPHLIGRKLSQKYRFAEGAAMQREALKFEPEFLSAKAQLANDLLRLGQDEEGWKLAEEVQKADPYDVVAYNLTTLREAIAGFRTLNSEHFIVRMEPKEASIYGDKALALLERAHATLTRKYGLELRERTIVEIFPDQKDFAIRTFGLPGGSGYLGVCFGRVITANSPASRPGSPSNWESVLWHEFTHVITLTLTKNKMPRWLSEGISVFEERQVRSSWGEQMKPRYRAMMLSEDLTPVSELSGAFLKPKTAIHLGFAYYESSLVVEWLMERWGLEKMKRLLVDLGRGVEINTALATHFAPIDKLDAEFAARAQQLAKSVGPKLDWTRPSPAQMASEDAVEEFISKNPANFVALMEKAKKLAAQKKWVEVKEPLTKLIDLYPNQHDSDGAYSLLARAHRELGERDEEIATLTKLADLAADATDAFERLMQLAAERKDWRKVLEYAARYEAVDPLQIAPHRYEAEAHEAMGKRAPAITSYQVVLQLEPPDPADVHYRLGRLLHAGGDPAAKRHVLMALEEAPRFRAAHELLLEIAKKSAAAEGAVGAGR